MFYPDGSPMAIISEEARNERTVIIDAYESDGSRETREVEAYSTRTSQVGSVRLHCWCLKRNDSRSFTVGNIVSAVPTGNSFEPRWDIEL